MISLQDLERMVDSSLSIADKVIWDHREIKGELYVWRHAKWRYFPFDFEVVYTVTQGVANVTKFGYCLFVNESVQGEWTVIRDTAAYQELLVQADIARKQVP